ncbi:GNAT family N-acetyltransferase [Actinomycetospora sp. TBRC 11914]|uniref:GNAT family N-acetyltransferase n=1 Tax=Actinomycetospora sp. TBRC 11914 TaxID=2729387 RepID=UPI00145EFC57|nr:GNAT family N-acetyltransferase [Actinomycetospora sp. TBRC 11914]NMO93576.1 GNAT family N-acetyltransferase [Actinomycetospora sp. TBRC 11914]
MVSPRHEAPAVHRRVRLRSGDPVVLRTLRPEDQAGLGAMFEELSTSSRFQRFLSGKPTVSAHALRRLADVDHRDHEALVAVTAEEGDVVGEARWIRDGDDHTVAEMAITVADTWQQRGLGTELAHDLARRAAEEGVEEFTAEVLTDNSGIRRLVEHLGEVDDAAQQDGISTLRVSTAGHGAAPDDGLVRQVLRSAARGDFLVVPRPLRWWLRLSGEITKTLMVPVEMLFGRR